MPADRGPWVDTIVQWSRAADPDLMLGEA